MARIVGAHSIVYSTDAESDRAFLRDVIGLPHVDVGHGWLIFGLPPAEVAVHPSDENDLREFYLMVDDVGSFVKEMSARGVACTAPMSLGWGVLTSVTLPGGGKLVVYQPRHARPATIAGKVATKTRSTKRAAKKAVKKAPKKAPPKAARRRR